MWEAYIHWIPTNPEVSLYMGNENSGYSGSGLEPGKMGTWTRTVNVVVVCAFL